MEEFKKEIELMGKKKGLLEGSVLGQLCSLFVDLASAGKKLG